jgi:hypothetical protein
MAATTHGAGEASDGINASDRERDADRIEFRIAPPLLHILRTIHWHRKAGAFRTNGQSLETRRRSKENVYLIDAAAGGEGMHGVCKYGRWLFKWAMGDRPF